MKMPFGKHEGKELTEIPKGYLRWLRSQDWVAGWLAQGLDKVLKGETERQSSTDDLVGDIVTPFEVQMGWPWAGDEDE